MVYGGEYFLKAKFSAKGPVVYAVDRADAAQVNGSRLRILKAGLPFAVTASHAGDSTWRAAQAQAFGGADRRPQKIAFTLKTNRVVGGQFNLLVTVNSQLPVAIVSSNPQIVRINENGTATALAKGKAVLIATQAGDPNHLPAKLVKKIVTVK